MNHWEGIEIKVNRIVNPCWDGKVIYQLHVFTDASYVAMSASIYLRTITENKIESRLIFGKSLVIPSNMPEARRTIPNLELHAAMLSCKYAQFIWTDSTDVLDFLLSNKKFDRFIKNRLNKLRNFCVKHIEGENNPSDFASRGSTPQELKNNHLWWYGPSFLVQRESEWNQPLKTYDPDKIKCKEETLPLFENCLTLKDEEKIKQKSKESDKNKITKNEGSIQKQNSLIEFERFSNWYILIHTMAYVKRMFKKVDSNKKEIFNKIKLKDEPERSKELRNFNRISVSEINEAENEIIKIVQRDYPPDENMKRNLNLFLDEQNIWRAKGRFNKSVMEYDMINPIFIHHNSPITHLLIRKAHLETKHGGIELINCNLRQKYWITNSRRTIGNWLKSKKKTNCGICARWGAKSFTTTPTDLPECRVSGSAAFQSVGIDYFGPFVTNSLEFKKCWGVIFTCTLTRSIHLEVVSDCTSEKFLLAFIRFIRRRRVPHIVISDNAPTFVLANKVIQKMCSEEKQQKNEWIEVMKSDKVQDFFLLKRIQWKFNTAYSPWRGAFYERLIGSIKHHLYRVIGKKIIQFEELYTLLIEVERILNERPLTYYTSRELVIPLRPIDILDCSVENPSGINLTSMIDEDQDYEPTKSNATNLLRAHQLAMLKSHNFWKQWKDTYLLNLRERWHQVKSKNIGFPYIDQIVLIKSENDQCPRSLWSRGRINKIITDRTVQIQVGNKYIVRPVNLLFPLETENESENLEECVRTFEKEVNNKKNDKIEVQKVNTIIQKDLAELVKDNNLRKYIEIDDNKRVCLKDYVSIVEEEPAKNKNKLKITANINNQYNFNIYFIIDMAHNRQIRNRAPLEARSPFLIITDRRVEELREYLRNENIRLTIKINKLTSIITLFNNSKLNNLNRSMVFEPATWDRHTIGREINITTRVDVCIVNKCSRTDGFREFLYTFNNSRCRVRRKIWMRISERIDYPGLGNIIRQVEPYYFADMIVMSEAARIPRILDQQERNRNRNLVNRLRHQANYGSRNNNSSRNYTNENNFRRNNFERNPYFNVRQNNYRRSRDTSRERIREEIIEPRIKRARIIENNVRENRIIIPEIITNRGNNNLQNKRESNRLEIKDVGILQINEKQEKTKEINEEKLKQFQELFEEMKKYINIADPIAIENKVETSTSNKIQEDKNVVKLGKQIEFNGGKENLEEIGRIPLGEMNEEILNINAKSKPSEIKNTLVEKEYDKIKDFVREKWTRITKIYLVGSQTNQLAKKDSDLDIVIIDATNEERDILISKLVFLKNLLTNNFKYDSYYIRKKARIPILELITEQLTTQLKIQIQFNNFTPIFNSRYITTIINFYPWLKPTYFTLQLWCKKFEINEPINGTLSSYMLMLMIVFYLHYNSDEETKALLERHEQIFTNRTSKEEEINQLLKEINVNNKKSEKNCVEFLIGFFKFYNEFNFEDHGISVRGNQIYERQEPKEKAIEIEEPFSRDNSTQSITKAGLLRIKLSLSFTWQQIKVNKLCKDGLLELLGVREKNAGPLGESASKIDEIDVDIEPTPDEILLSKEELEHIETQLSKETEEKEEKGGEDIESGNGRN
uniref:Integrase catalytic domain-containing protein n=1 Tax=Meloidogyne enterolobii TaxID=390850 RepID=A0A6V7TJ75_MELEN|nr:unnamed protein product [Meloidogyne enterolobii]